MGNSFAHADILSSQPGGTFLRTRREVLFHPIPTNRDKIITNGPFHHGQVPQTGRGSIQLLAPSSKYSGSEGICETHHPDRSRLNNDAS